MEPSHQGGALMSPSRLPFGSSLVDCLRRLARLQTTREMHPRPSTVDKRDRALDRVIVAARQVLRLGAVVLCGLLFSVSVVSAAERFIGVTGQLIERDGAVTCSREAEGSLSMVCGTSGPPPEYIAQVTVACIRPTPQSPWQCSAVTVPTPDAPRPAGPGNVLGSLGKVLGGAACGAKGGVFDSDAGECHFSTPPSVDCHIFGNTIQCDPVRR